MPNSLTKKLPTILQNIIATKHEEVAVRRKAITSTELKDLIIKNNISSRGFYDCITRDISNGKNAIIAEVKKASPSKGIICENFNPESIAKSYEKYGATCLSVLTDEKYFQGSELYLQQARAAVNLPVLRKDFIVDEYQIFESKYIGADCILLIVACLSREEIENFLYIANELSIDVLVEVHTLAEIEKVAGLPINLIGINNRDLHSFKVDLSTCTELKKHLPKEVIVVAESGIATVDDIGFIHDSGINAFLIGESFMKYENPGKALYELFSKK